MGEGPRVLCREFDRKCRADTDLARCVDFTAMAVDNRLHQCKTDARAFGINCIRALSLKELGKQFREVIGIDAYT